MVIKDMYKMDIFPEYAPYYEYIMVDSRRKVLLIKDINVSYKPQRGMRCGIYDIEGRYKGRGEIEFGGFKVKTSRIYINNGNWYLSVMEDEEEFLKLMKFRINGAPKK